jgi:integrase
MAKANEVGREPKPNGNGWRFRWVNPADRADGVQTFCNPDKRVVQQFIWWLEEKGFRASDDDPWVTTGGWLYEWRGTPVPAAMQPKGDVPTFLEYAKSVYRMRREHELISAATERRDLGHLQNHVADWLDLPITECTRDLLDKKITELRTRKAMRSPYGVLSANTQVTVISRIALVLRHAHEAGKIPAYPLAADGGRPRISTRAMARVAPHTREPGEVTLTLQDCRRLIAAADEIDHERAPLGWIKPEDMHLHDGQTGDLLRLLLGTGLRISEVHGLQVRHLQRALEGGALRLPVEVALQYDERGRAYRGTPKGGTKGSVQISGRLAARLEKYIPGREPGAALFPAPQRGDRGWTYATWRAGRWLPLVERAVEAHGLSSALRLHIHCLRKNHGTLLLAHNTGLDVADVQRSLRHQSLATTQAAYLLETTQGEDRVRQAAAIFNL